MTQEDFDGAIGAELSRERLRESPARSYVDYALQPSYFWMLRHYYADLMRTHAAWAVVLADGGVLSASAAGRLAEVCLTEAADVPRALREFDPKVEYFYSAVEGHLTSLLGAEASNLNIGRTRPEPLARMTVRRLLLELLNDLASLRNQALEIAARTTDALMLQWTHFQPAQPSTFGHYFEAVAEVLERDWARGWTALAAINRSTLGSGALAGTSYPVDRQLAARLLGFADVQPNTLDCVAATDHLLDAGYAATSALTTMSRFCQDLWTWHTQEFALIEIGDEYSGSSSLMPQKKNPYPFEYIRIAANRANGDLAAAFAMSAKTDFQDTKDVEEGVVECVVELVERAIQAIRLLTATLTTIQINWKRAEAAAGSGFSTATEIAAVLHRGNPGLSSREAHRIVGSAVASAIRDGRTALASDDLIAAATRLRINLLPGIADSQRVTTADAFVRAHGLMGGPAPSATRRLVSQCRARLRRDRRRISGFDAKLSAASAELERRVASLSAA